jgi:hypothetical protein
MYLDNICIYIIQFFHSNRFLESAAHNNNVLLMQSVQGSIVLETLLYSNLVTELQAVGSR